MNPEIEGVDLESKTERTLSWIKESHECALRDYDKAGEWRNDRAYYSRRRYTEEHRNVDYPWPGASELVIPTLDKYIDQQKPHYLRMIVGDQRPVIAQPLRPDPERKSAKVERWFSWLITNGGSRSFISETELFIDSLCEMGRGIYRTVWDYETRISTDVIRKDRMPTRLAQIKVAKSKREAEKGQALAEQAGLGDAIVFISPDEVEQMRALTEMITDEFGLELDTKLNKKALSKTREWFKRGMAEPLVIDKDDIVSNVPGVVAVNPLDLIVPQGTGDIQDADQIVHRMFMSTLKFRREAHNRGWNISAAKAVLEAFESPEGARGSRPIYYEDEERAKFGSTGGNSESVRQIEVYDIFGWYSPTPFGQQRKVQLTIAKDFPDYILAFRPVTRASGLFPFHTASFEHNTRSWYSPRGIPELLDDIDLEITFNHRAKVNLLQIATAPSYLYRPNGQFDPNWVNWRPGAFYPSQNPDRDVRLMETPQVPFAHHQEESVLRMYGEERLGSTDLGLVNPTSQSSEPRTAQEIKGIQGRQALGLLYRGGMFSRCISEVYQEMFDLWHTFGPSKVWVKQTGQDPILVTKEEMQGQFLINPRATLHDPDPATRAQMLLQRVIALAQAAPLVGDKYVLDMGEAVRDWIEAEDFMASTRIMREREPEELQALQQQRDEFRKRMEAVYMNMGTDPRSALLLIAELEKKGPFGKLTEVSEEWVKAAAEAQVSEAGGIA